jgi:hypothetical protein
MQFPIYISYFLSDVPSATRQCMQEHGHIYSSSKDNITRSMHIINKSSWPTGYHFYLSAARKPMKDKSCIVAKTTVRSLLLSRFANLVRRNYILLIKTSLYICALSRLLIGLCWCILRVILLGRISSNYLFLKWQYSSIGPQIMTNFVKIGTKESPQSGENWL